MYCLVTGLFQKTVFNGQFWLILLIIVVSHFACREQTIADELSKYKAEEVISHIMTVYSRVQSARGRIKRTFESGDVTTTFSGRFAVRRPDKLLVEFVGGVHQYTSFDGKVFRIYFRKENRGVFIDAEKMSSLERFILGPEPFFGNVLQLMDKGFSIEAADIVEGNLILKATPLKPYQFNFILIKVDAKNWTIRAVEHFDLQNTLVNQIRYLEFRSVGDSLFFPTKTVSSSIVNEKIMVETSDLSRVEINVSLGDNSFQIPSNTGTEWISKSALEENIRK